MTSSNQLTISEDSYIILPNLFEKQKPLVLIVSRFCDRNKNKSKDFIQKF